MKGSIMYTILADISLGFEDYNVLKSHTMYTICYNVGQNFTQFTGFWRL